MGLGSGIVWESDAKNEFEEVLLKSKFLTEPLDYFEIFETMRLENGSIKFLNDHIARMKSAADYFLFKFREKRMRKFLVELIKSIDPYQHKKIKLFLNKWGQFRSEISDVVKVPKSIRVIFSEKEIHSEDRFRYFKTTNRKLYDDEYDRCIHRKFHEVLFLNEQDKVVEGSRTNLFIRLGKTWLTPPLNSGALPGIYRNYFIQNHPEVLEQEINVADLVKADEVILTNAVQGEIKVSRIYLTQEEFVNFN
ncbi:MAG: aminotransferase class IV [Ignavibacteriaceae bacterium]|nr:aminotransferase class IV [Ignavibacteriaceae bacterium]